MLLDSGAGFGAVALAGLLDSAMPGSAGAASTVPSSAAMVDRPGRAKSVIFLFMEGGPSHMDTFDPKPALQKLAGQSVPDCYSLVLDERD